MSYNNHYLNEFETKMMSNMSSNQYHTVNLNNGCIMCAQTRYRTISYLSLGLSGIITRPYVVVYGKMTHSNQDKLEQIYNTCKKLNYDVYNHLK